MSFESKIFLNKTNYILRLCHFSFLKYKINVVLCNITANTHFLILLVVQNRLPCPGKRFSLWRNLVFFFEILIKLINAFHSPVPHPVPVPTPVKVPVPVPIPIRMLNFYYYYYYIIAMDCFILKLKIIKKLLL